MLSFALDTGKLRDSLITQLITQKALAQKAGLTEKTVQRIINGRRANAITLGKLAAALGVNHNELLKEES